VPNRRRRKLSTALSAAAALAVASPCAYFLVYESTAADKPTEHHEFKRAAQITDLPNELIGALSQGLSQFGINLPNVPSLTGASGASPGLGSPGLTSPGLTSPGLTGTPGLTSPGLTGTPGLTSPGLTGTPGLTSPGLTSPGTTPGALATPGGPLTPTTPTPAAGVNPALSNPALTSPAGVTPGVATPGAANPAIGSPIAAPGEVPITSPGTGLDPGADGTYPILGDPSSLGGLPGTSPAAAAAPSGGGGLVNDLMQAANQLGAGQAIDLLKGMVLPAITQGMQGGAAGAPGAGLPAGGIPAPSLPAGLQGAGLPGALPGAALPAAAGVPGALPAAAAAPAAGAAVPTLTSAPVEALPTS